MGALLRRATRGRATTYHEDGSVRSTSTLEVFRYWQILPPAEEALVRRVSWLNNILRCPNNRRQLIVALFGRAEFENNDTHCDAIHNVTNPWAQMFLEDIQHACEVPE
eukprot:3328193-Pyramimonas_sp.AAC.1